MNFGILRLYCGDSGKKGFYNMQELGMAKSMAKLGYKVFIFLLFSDIEKIEEENILDNIYIIKVPCKKIGTHGFFDKKIISKYDINLLQIASDNQLYAPNVMKYCRKNNIKYYTYIGTIDTDSNSVIRRIISKISFRRIKKELNKCNNYAKTPSVEEKLVSKGVKSVSIMPVGLDFSNIPDITEGDSDILLEYRIPKNKKIILFVGRLEEYKNPLKTVDLIKKLDENYHLIIVGKGSLYEELFKRIEENNLKEKITYIKEIKNEEIHKLYKISDYYVNFNRNEIFGMSILEALYSGDTVIAFHASGPDYILRENAGYLVNTVDEMVEVINENKIKNRKDLKNYVKINFNWDENAKKINESSKR